jgi:hypothetical protein
LTKEFGTEELLAHAGAFFCGGIPLSLIRGSGFSADHLSPVFTYCGAGARWGGGAGVPLRNLRFVLMESCTTCTFNTVKTVTTREFFHSPTSVKTLRPGQSLAVTDDGKPSFTVTKAGKRPRLTRDDLDRRAVTIGRKADLVADIITMRRQSR